MSLHILSVTEDKQLLAELKQGQAAAVRRWYALYHAKLLRVMHSKVGNPKDAEELTQDTFMSCLKHLPLFRGESSIWTWMQRIAQHEVADFYRKYYAKKTIHALALDELLLGHDVSDATETSQKVKAALQQLRADYRELLMLKYIDKKKVVEIARDWGRTVKSIESDLFRARHAFKLALAGAEGVI